MGVNFFLDKQHLFSSDISAKKCYIPLSTTAQNQYTVKGISRNKLFFISN